MAVPALFTMKLEGSTPNMTEEVPNNPVPLMVTLAPVDPDGGTA
jgi:hypothetical protein